MVAGEERPYSRERDSLAAIRQRIASTAPPHPRLKLAPLWSPVLKRMAAERDWVVVPFPALDTACSLAEQSLSRQEQLKELKSQNRDLNSQYRQALSIKAHKESEHERITESISDAVSTNEKLKTSIMELRNKRDKYTSVISDQLQDHEAREVKANEDAILLEKLEVAVSWFNKFAGLQVIAGEEGVKFVFDKINPLHLEKEYSFHIKIDNGTYNLVQCDLPVKDFEELVKELNLTGDLLKFLKVTREKFQAASVNGNLPLRPVTCPDVSLLPSSPAVTTTVNPTSEAIPSVPFSPPVTTTGNPTNEAVSDQTNSRSKNKRIPAKRGLASTPGSVRRRSPRLEGLYQREN